ncbi:probable cysteine--tRNA ligase, mitochondrial [Polistes fuscatus]|uniref:probable cysteine--tRNA ligase, mitochondrial n=1 Tax=Polistes fuscatus TaxID=30207 RepID=UPI001CA8557F|nr:probable cysteine--tRNA ligase, mitochondrial [Polistes fuscatus]XP_043492052.1 probable cysteine--tRNA ligase, mitochondrial [Polistes fuscatus]XP_043492053.1 probable cysteine--tRNA ligase, mitochondrial [Polistes fuscatus]
MYLTPRRIYYNLLKQCQCFVTTSATQEKKFKWIEPMGTDTGIKLYNPITKTKVPLILRKEGFLTWYMCGPTVYDSAHIGHAITYVRSDILRRILSEYFNIHTIMIMGITDIDDKIIKRAAEKGIDFRELSKFYENEFFNDMEILNVTMPYLNCRVTEYIPQIMEFITNILDKNGAYIAKDGSVYFDTKSYNKYGKLIIPFTDSNHSDKRSSLDFALWKAAKDKEPYWESPWGRGRPGWHIECSVMASAVFGKTIDIHSGGIDLMFPHHENEEAQSCCYHNVEQWVNYWLHCGHLCLKDDIKMSKSLKNTISIKKFLEKYTANDLRMLCLLSHYRNDIIYSDDVIDHAVSVMNKIENFISECNHYLTDKINSGNVDESSLIHNLHETKSMVHMALTNDFNTAQAIRAILNLVDISNKMLFQNNSTYNDKGKTAIAAVSVYISNILSIFGFTQSKSTIENRQTEDIVKYFVEFRNIVRNRVLEQKQKDEVLLHACDTARKNLSTCGITVKDRKGVSTWDYHKVT